MICRFAVAFASADALAGRTLQGGAGEGARWHDASRRRGYASTPGRVVMARSIIS